MFWAKFRLFMQMYWIPVAIVVGVIISIIIPIWYMAGMEESVRRYIVGINVASLPWGILQTLVFVGFLYLLQYGGGFATVPAYLADVFGTKYVSAVHGRLLTAWSAAGVFGPVLVHHGRPLGDRFLGEPRHQGGAQPVSREDQPGCLIGRRRRDRRSSTSCPSRQRRRAASASTMRSIGPSRRWPPAC